MHAVSEVERNPAASGNCAAVGYSVLPRPQSSGLVERAFVPKAPGSAEASPFSSLLARRTWLASRRQRNLHLQRTLRRKLQ
jgi:hypothetical protein